MFTGPRSRTHKLLPPIGDICGPQETSFVFYFVHSAEHSSQSTFFKFTPNIHLIMIQTQIYFHADQLNLLQLAGLLHLPLCAPSRVFNRSSSNSHQIFFGPISGLQSFFVSHWLHGGQLVTHWVSLMAFFKFIANIYWAMFQTTVHCLHPLLTFLATRGPTLSFLVSILQSRIFNRPSSNSQQISRSRLLSLSVTHQLHLWPPGANFIFLVCAQTPDCSN